MVYSSPRAALTASTASNWSVNRLLVSYSSRPINVDLPSSTLPAVANRNRSIRPPATPAPGVAGPPAVAAVTLISVMG